MIFDEVVLVEGKEYFWFGVIVVSNDGWLFVWLVDDNGFECFIVCIKVIVIGEVLFDEIFGMFLLLIWVVNDIGFVYLLVNE